MPRFTIAHAALAAVIFAAAAAAQTPLWTFTPPLGPASYALGPTLVTVLGDVDGDGIDDFALADPSYFAMATIPTPGNGRVWIHSGANGQVIRFFDRQNATVNNFAARIAAIGDVNNNGSADIVIQTIQAFSGPNNYAFVYDAMTGAALSTQQAPGDSSQYFAGIGDVNGDNCADLGMRGIVLGTVGVYPSNYTVCIETFKTIDLLPSPGVTLFTQTQNGIYSCGPALASTCVPVPIGLGRVRFERLDDINTTVGDEFVTGSRTPTVQIRVETGSGATVWTTATAWSDFDTIDDLNGDGIRDIVILSNVAETGAPLGRVRALSGLTGAVVFNRPFTAASAPGFFSRIHAAGDVDRDGYPDYAVSDVGTTLLEIRVFSGKNGSVISAVHPPTGQSFQDDFDTSGDFDGDGIHDLLVGAAGGRQVYIYSLIPPGVSYFGVGGPANGQTLPEIGVGGSLSPGQTFTINVRGVVPNAFSVLLIGLSDDFWNGQALPFDLGIVGLPGQQLYVSADFPDYAYAQPIGVSTTRAGASYNYVAPILPITGFTFYAQWFIIDDDTSPSPSYRVSNAATLIFL